MSSWYRADELAHRIAIFFAGVALANTRALPIRFPWSGSDSNE